MTHFTRMKAGLVLSEIIVSLGLLGIMALSVTGVFSYLAFSSQTNSDRAAAKLLAEGLLERAVKAGPDLVQGKRWGVGTELLHQELQTADSSEATRFTYQLSPVRLETSPLGSLYQVTVEVKWLDDKARHQAKGSGVFRLSRTVYIEDDGLYSKP